ncbi:phage tail protein [Helicobacter cappadocius]|uniref:Phage tail protein n=1 Tax=Helicobacter cappadocius TaxID=3063998 RepID=A0AA90PLR3_9HELI|nr:MULTISPECIES: phage tail protein [unclassified Helicobacter]MDO7253884.1 phage tail protein [Helicobacter sp. faydin-H75]MDP2539745.1 phage tail protein [Helicobacter sp. faydin-H76]
MSAKYGINIELNNNSTKDIAINNTRTIAIVGDDDKKENQGLKYYPSIKEALNNIGEGSIKDVLDDLKSSALQSNIIISSFIKSDNANEDVLKAIDDLILSEQSTGYAPKFVLASGYDNSKGVWEKLKTTCDKIGAIYAISLNATQEDKILEEIKDYQSKRAIITYQKVYRTDNVIRGLGAFIIASYAKVMASSEYGFAQSFSNRIIDGIIGIVDKTEFISGEDCIADRLRSVGVSLVISDGGLRAYGGENRDSDFSSLHSVVIFDTIIESIRKSQKEAIDKQVSDVLKKVVDDLESFYRKLVANNVAVGFEVSIPEDLNTNESIAEGKIYINHQIQEMPLLKNITNKIYKVNSYSVNLIKEL